MAPSKSTGKTFKSTAERQVPKRIIDQVIGAGQSNVLMGEFSVNCDLGFKIEKGEIKGRVKNAMVTGNIYELLNNILGIGKETQFVGSTCTPAFYFAQVNVAS